MFLLCVVYLQVSIFLNCISYLWCLTLSYTVFYLKIHTKDWQFNYFSVFWGNFSELNAHNVWCYRSHSGMGHIFPYCTQQPPLDWIPDFASDTQKGTSQWWVLSGSCLPPCFLLCSLTNMVLRDLHLSFWRQCHHTSIPGTPTGGANYKLSTI